MIATVRLDNELENTLLNLTNVLQKRKSDIIRDAINFYAKNIKKDKKSRILNAISKTKEIDKQEFDDFEHIIIDGLSNENI
jgi:predicted DNA-binding protein